MRENGVDELILSCSWNEVGGNHGAATEVNPCWCGVQLTACVTDAVDTVDDAVQAFVSLRVLVYQSFLPSK